MSKPRPNIVLVGFMGSGKSTVGRRLARQLGWRMRDTDKLVEQRAGARISDIFATSGEAGFRAIETDVLHALAESLDRTVLATGGGIILSAENRQLLRAVGFTVWLTATPDALFERVSRNTNRPLLLNSDPRGTLDRLIAERTPLYTEVADCIVDSTHLSHRATVDAILSRARQYFGPDVMSAARSAAE